MKVSENQIQNALLQLFHDLRLALGDPVQLQRLDQLWTATTLRRSDLLQGVARLAARGFVDIRGEDDDTCLVLTESGHAAMLEVDASDWYRHFNEQLLPALRRRQAQADTADRGRRGYELASEPQVQWPKH